MATTIKGVLAHVLPVAILIAAAGTAQAETGGFDQPKACCESTGPHPEFVDNDFIGEQGVRSAFAPEDFTIGFETDIPFSGGSLQPVNLGTDPIMGALTTGFGHAIYNLLPCGVVFPHVHPRGDENVFVIEGTIDAGFVDEAGTLIRDAELAPGTAFVIPQGYVHFVANPTCESARAVVTLPSSDGGVYGAISAVLGMPPSIIQAFTPGVTEEAILQLQASVAAAGVISVDPVCQERCAGGRGSYGQ